MVETNLLNMGLRKFSKKKYQTPFKLWDRNRIIFEKELKEKFNLKNVKEVWKSYSTVHYYKRKLLTNENNQFLIDTLRSLNVELSNDSGSASISENLVSNTFLDRRLQSVVQRKFNLNSGKVARQLIKHRKIALNGNIITIPSFICNIDLEQGLELRQ